MIKKFLIALGGFALVVVLLGAVKAAQIQEMMSQNMGQPMTTVSTVKSWSEQWYSVINAIGSLAPVQGVVVSAELEGTVVSIPVENGAAVQQGDLLIALDTTVEQAQLEASQARAALAKLQVDRASQLRDSNTISQAEYDAAAAQHAQAIAEVAAIQASIAKKAIRAPFAGRVGIRQVNLGQFVSRGTALIPLQQLDPMYVNFYIPQRQLPKVALGQTVKVGIDAYPNEAFPAEVSAINPVVDMATRNIAVQATLPNPTEELRAGMFAQVEVVLPEQQDVVVVPSTAVAYASYGNSVFILEEMKDETGATYLGVRQQPVTLGPKRGDLVAILEGLAADEEVASAGVFKLRNGMPVRVNNEVQPSVSANPTPDNT